MKNHSCYSRVLLTVVCSLLWGCGDVNQSVLDDATAVRCAANMKKLGVCFAVFVTESPELAIPAITKANGSAMWSAASASARNALIPQSFIKCPNTGSRYRGPVNSNKLQWPVDDPSVIFGMCADCGNILRGGNSVVRFKKDSKDYATALAATAQ